MNQARDLSDTIESITYALEHHEGKVRHAIRHALEEPDNPHQYRLLGIPSDLARGLLQRYLRGDAIEAMQQYFNDGYRPALQQASELSAKFFPDHRLRLHFDQLGSWMLLFALVCFDEDGSQMTHLDNWFTPDCNPLLYAMIRKALVHEDAYAYEPDPQQRAMPHEEPLARALLQLPSSWPHALGAYMKQWPRLMKRHGYREHVEPGRHGFGYTPLHLGLAVCAFDIDDSAFRHLPYYPHELVDYYRNHRRHTRDAWRTWVSDPAQGLSEQARPQPVVTYVLSKAEAYTRWIALVCGERPALIDAARKAAGKRKTMPAMDALLEALASVGLGIHADLKDDDTVAAQAAALCNVWNLAPPLAPDTARQGPARITVILNRLQERDATQGQRLAVFDDGGENWNALLYSCHHEAEFTTLCEQLGVKRMDRSQWQ